MATKKFLYRQGLIVVAAMMLFQSCYHYRISTTNFDPSTHYRHKMVSSFFWGLVQKRQNGIDVVASNCDSLKLKSLDEVRVTTNLGYALLTVVTIGIWCPMDFEWKCPKPCPREGDIH